MKNCPKDALIYIGFSNGNTVTLKNCEIYFKEKETSFAKNSGEIERFDHQLLRFSNINKI